MKATAYLEKQLGNVHAIFQEYAQDITEREWTARTAPGHNVLGYMIWHIPRTQDSFVNTWIRGGAEVVQQPRWAHWRALKPLGVGIGITLAQADSIAHTVKLAETLEYASAVHQDIVAWLRGIDDDAFDQIPDIDSHLSAYPEYQTPGFRADTDGLRGQAVWSLLMRPCIGHVHRHLGELELSKMLLRR